MNKLLAILVALTIISGAFSYMCSSNSTNATFYCDNRDTCCPGRNVSSWRCCGGNQATCCSDGVSCCPGRTVCDLYNRRCVPKLAALAFLSTENFEDETFKLSTPAVEGDYGVAFPDIKKIMKCIMEAVDQAPDVYKDVKELIDMFKQGKFLEVLLKLKDLQGEGKDLYYKCKNIK